MVNVLFVLKIKISY